MLYAYNHWRREFRGEGEENCSGILVWQLNDVWPGISWSLVDVDLRRKAAFWVTKRALGKVVVGGERRVTGFVFLFLLLCFGFLGLMFEGRRQAD